MRAHIIRLIAAGISCLVLSHHSSAGDLPKLKSMQELRLEGIERQTMDYSCGAAALSILLSKYFGDSYEEEDLLSDLIYHLSEEELSESMEKGFSMLDLKRVAERLGYRADGVKLPQGAGAALRGPVLILLRTRGLNHFVVLRGVKENRAFIIDPSRGHIRMQVHELYKYWSGETLILSRDGFGMPTEHALALPNFNRVAPERNSVRALQYSPLR